MSCRQLSSSSPPAVSTAPAPMPSRAGPASASPTSSGSTPRRRRCSSPPWSAPSSACSNAMREAAEGFTGMDAKERMGDAYVELLRDETFLKLQLHAYAAACDDADVREATRRGFGRLWDERHRADRHVGRAVPRVHGDRHAAERRRGHGPRRGLPRRTLPSACSALQRPPDRPRLDPNSPSRKSLALRYVCSSKLVATH